jgi:hypothetical protein
MCTLQRTGFYARGGTHQTKPSVNMSDVISQCETCQMQTPKIRKIRVGFSASALSSYVKTQCDCIRCGGGGGGEDDGTMLCPYTRAA